MHKKNRDTVFDLNIRWTQKGALIQVEEIVKRERF